MLGQKRDTKTSGFKNTRLKAQEIELIEKIHKRYNFWSGADLEEVIQKKNMEKLFELLRMSGEYHDGFK